MAQRLDDSETVSFKELLMASSIQLDALAQLMIRKGFPIRRVQVLKRP